MDTDTLHPKLFNDAQFSTYAVVDGAALPELLTKLEEYKPEHTCLFRGELPFDLAEAAPYLVKLEANSTFAKWLTEQSLSFSCCIYARSEKDFITVRKHFRSLLNAELPNGETVHFRYYDPRVLNIYFPTCLDEEKQVLFRDIKDYLIFINDTKTLVSFENSNHKAE